MNSWSFTARLARDAELKSPNGKTMVSFAAACESGWGERKKTTFVDCTLWGERGAKLADYLKKGAMVGLVGEHGTREHNGKVITTLNVHDVTLLGGKPEAPRQESRPAQSGPATPPLDDIPW